MTFDKQAFMLARATQPEALSFIRKEAEAGRQLSPRATKMVADLFDPDVPMQGRKPRTLDVALVYLCGKLRAFHQYRLLPKLPGQHWKELVPKYLGYDVSGSTIERHLSTEGDEED